mgnify:CR=1 FL=1
MEDLVNKLDNLTLSYIENKVQSIDEIEELNLLVEKLKISTFTINEKQQIFYWVLCQSDTINKKLFEKEGLQIGYAY